ILPLMLASVIADLVTYGLLPETLMTEKLARRGIRVTGDLHMDPLALTPVHEVMARDVVTLPAAATRADALARFEGDGHSAYPLVDEAGRCVGMISRKHLLLGRADPETPLAALGRAGADVIAAHPDEPVLDALLRMTHEQVDHLPVLGPDRRLLG